MLSSSANLLCLRQSQANQAGDESVDHLRQLSNPLNPSCGSVFKRPVGPFAGQLISEAGLKGYRIGGVEVSEKHAGFMVNVDNGTAKGL